MYGQYHQNIMKEFAKNKTKLNIKNGFYENHTANWQEEQMLELLGSESLFT